MKKIITFLFVAFLVQAKAQIVFPAKGADWHYMVSNGGFAGPTYYTNAEIKYKKDTLFTGKNVALLSNISNFILPGIKQSNTYIYASNDTVYFYNATTLNQWQVLYNFNCMSGQGWETHLQDSSQYTEGTLDTINVIVDSVKYNMINGFSLKSLYVKYTLHRDGYPISYGQSVIYDRIGNVNYLLNFLTRNFVLCDGCSEYAGLLCYQDSTFTLYQPDITKDCNYTTVGIKQLIDDEHITIYPNPAQNTLQVVVSDDPIAELKITDMLGKEMSCEALNIRQDKTQINVSGLKAGIYFITVKTKQANYAAKFIKE